VLVRIRRNAGADGPERGLLAAWISFTMVANGKKRRRENNNDNNLA
jgi:hypothetical protein